MYAKFSLNDACMNDTTLTIRFSPRFSFFLGRRILASWSWHPEKKAQSVNCQRTVAAISCLCFMLQYGATGCRQCTFATMKFLAMQCKPQLTTAFAPKLGKTMLIYVRCWRLSVSISILAFLVCAFRRHDQELSNRHGVDLPICQQRRTSACTEHPLHN